MNEQIPPANDDQYEADWTWKDYAAMSASYAIVGLLAWLMIWPA